MSNVVITSLHDFIKNFSKDGTAKFPNENVSALTQQINAVCERLSEVKALTYDTPFHIITVLTL